MNWQDILKGMKCPRCGKRAFGIKKDKPKEGKGKQQVREPKSNNRRFYAQHAMYECTECGYGEKI